MIRIAFTWLRAAARPVAAPRRQAILVLALVAVACSGSAPDVGAQLGTPSAVTVFRGVTEKRPGVAPYVVVANGGSDQLTIIDPVDDSAVRSPGLVFPLAVPTDGSPMFVAAAPLSDGGADALVVSGAHDPATGAVDLQLVSTWDGRPRPVASFPIGAGGDLILAILGVPVPQDAAPEAGVVPPEAGAGRFLVAMNGGRLVVIRAERQEGGGIALRLEGTLALGAATPFDAVSLAPSPDGRRVYAASLDVVTGTDGTAALGVAEIDTLGDDPAAWTVRAIDARAGTYGVAAARVIERSVDDGDVFDRAQLENGGRLLVYALPERSTCGPTRAIDCGILTLDPERGTLAEDPLGEMPWRAPMPIPVLPIAIATWDRPPEVGAATDQISDPGDGKTIPAVFRNGLRYSPGTGARATSALALVTGADGRAYSFDLGRWGPGSDQSLLRAPVQTRVHSVSVATDPRVAPQIGMWREAAAPTTDEPDPQPELQLTAATMGAAMLVTPGYTPDDRWTLGWQYPLSGLAGRAAVLVRDDAHGLVVAMQARDSVGDGTWRDVVGLYSPMLGVRRNDVVEVVLSGAEALPQACRDFGEGRVAEILPPDPERWPGGALVLSPPVDPPARSDETPRDQVYACWSELEPGIYAGFATIYSAEWVLQGASFGYVGRPQPDIRFSVDYPGRDGEAYVEQQLEQACAIPSWPPPEPVPVCDDACRDTCEKLNVARRSRRFYYPQEDCQDSLVVEGVLGCAVTGRPARFPESLLVGPVLEFRFGLNPDTVNAEHPLVRSSNVSWSTASGLSHSFRSPIDAGQATGAVGFDRSPWTEAEPRIVFYVSYTGDTLFEAAFGAFATESKQIR